MTTETTTLMHQPPLEWWQVTNHAVEAVYHAATGKSAADFTFQEGITPLSETWMVGLALVSYLTVVFGLRKIMEPQKEMPLKAAFAVHNALLAGASLVLLLLLAEIITPIIVNHGLFYAMCDAASYGNHRLQFIYYLNYLSKYWELVDTVFLVLQKKELKFLHVYHHSLTMVLCFTQLRGEVSVQWVPIILNVFVHVIMYYYYFLTATGHKNIWWRQWVTTSQIIQFVIDLAACYFALGTAYMYRLNYPFTLGDCQGELFAGYWGCFLLSSYLYLFVELFYNYYIKPQAKKTDKKGAAVNGVADDKKSKKAE